MTLKLVSTGVWAIEYMDDIAVAYRSINVGSQHNSQLMLMLTKGAFEWALNIKLLKVCD